MSVFEKKITLPYTPHQLYTLVNDITAYPHFVPYCLQGQVLEEQPTYVVASLTLGSMGIQTSLTTHNTLYPDESIHMQLVKGPLRHLEGVWSFKEAPQGSFVTLHIDYILSDTFIDVLAGPLVEKVIHSMCDVFIQEAGRRYDTKL